MRVLDPGHSYALANLQFPGETLLRFMKDPKLHDGDGGPGTSCQEVLRALIDRVKTLDAEKLWDGNAAIVADLRHALALFEARALIRKVEKNELAIERLPTGEDGHLMLVGAEP